MRRLILPLLVTLFFAILFGNLLSSHMLEKKTDGLYSGGSTWGDLAWHLTLINNFEQRGLSTLWQNPIFSGVKLSYPFTFDLLSALLLKLGFSIQSSLAIPSFAILMLTIPTFYFLTYTMTKSKLSAFLTPFVFFFNGSIFGLYYFWQDSNELPGGMINLLGSMTKEYAHLSDYNIRFSNIIVDYILPQRTFIPGLLLGTVVIYFFWQYWQHENKKQLLKAGVVASLLPLIHTHTFISMVMLAGLLFTIKLISEPKKIIGLFASWSYFLFPTIIIGLPQLWLIRPDNTQTFFKFNYGWMKGEDSFIWFWFKNFSPHWILVLLGFLFVDRKVRLFFLAFCGLFVVTNLFQFQPHDYDNMKIMIWWYLACSILISYFIFVVATKLRYIGKVTALLLISLTLITGILSVYRETYTSWLMFSNEDLKFANFIKTNTPTESLFLTSDRHNSVITCLAGRRIVMGYRGWLWTHGFDYQQKEKNVQAIYSNVSEATHLIKDEKIDYILVENNQNGTFETNSNALEKYKIIYQSQNFTLYETQ